MTTARTEVNKNVSWLSQLNRKYEPISLIEQISIKMEYLSHALILPSSQPWPYSLIALSCATVACMVHVHLRAGFRGECCSIQSADQHHKGS